MTDNNIQKILSGTRAIIYTNSNFRYKGTITDTGSIFLTIHDDKDKHDHLIALNTIKEITILEATQ